MEALRPLREDDADAVVELYARAYGEARPIDAGEILSWLRNPAFGAEWLRVLEEPGRLVGYGDIWIADGVVALEVAAPGHWDSFLAWAEEAGRAAGADRVRVLSYAGRELPDAAAARGYRLWRSAYTMRIELDEVAPEVQPLPPGIVVRTFRPCDAEALRSALNETFARDPFFQEISAEHFRDRHLGARGADPSLWLVAWAGDEPAAFVLAFAERSGDPTVGRVQSLGVRPAFRRRGLGGALLGQAFAALHARGLRAIELGVDAENETGALGLYERAGMRVVRRLDSWQLELGHGRRALRG